MPTRPEPPDRDPTASAGSRPGRLPDPLGLHGLVAADGLDIVAGDPPVPISVWRVAGAGHAAEPGAAGGLTPRLAALLVGLYTRVGDTLVDLTANPAIAGAAGAGARRYLPVADPAGLAGLRHLDGTVGLIVLRWPPADADTDEATVPAGPTGLFTACRQLLAGVGYTVVALVPRSPRSSYLDHARLLIPAAHSAGLGYLQHIVAVTAPITSLTSPPPAARADAAAARASTHTRIHIDLLVLVIRGHRHD